MSVDPSFDSVSQGLHTALGAIFVLLPTAICLHHAAFGFGHPQIMGSFIGVVFAGVKEFAWDATMEITDVRGSDLKDFSFYLLGIFIANILLAI